VILIRLNTLTITVAQGGVMSCFLMLNSWAGEDQINATEKMARMFRMDPEEADSVVDNLSSGNPWQFDHQVSERQSQVAEPFLQSLGFDVECIPVMSDDGMGLGMSVDGFNESKPGLFGKIKNLFKKKN
jgi:hypothetical protein